MTDQSLVAPRLIRKGFCPVVILPSAGAGLLEVAKEMDNGAH